MKMMVKMRMRKMTMTRKIHEEDGDESNIKDDNLQSIASGSQRINNKQYSKRITRAVV